MDFHICWTIDCESSRREINDIALGQRAIDGFCEILESVGWRGTLFLTPEEIEPLANQLGRKAEAGHELGLHLHPDESGYSSPYLGFYSPEQQAEIVGRALERFQQVLGIRPQSARSGYGSANDASFPVFFQEGFRQTSFSVPGRKMSALASNWAGAPLFAHYAHRYNRFLEGGLDLVEIPISVDWETMIWGGVHPQDLRVEYTDAKNHAFTIHKIMKRQISENLPLMAILPFTHNIFEYADKDNFRRLTMEGMISEIIRYGKESRLSLIGDTIAEAAASFRAAKPLSGKDSVHVNDTA